MLVLTPASCDRQDSLGTPSGSPWGCPGHTVRSWGHVPRGPKTTPPHFHGEYGRHNMLHNITLWSFLFRHGLTPPVQRLERKLWAPSEPVAPSSCSTDGEGRARGIGPPPCHNARARKEGRKTVPRCCGSQTPCISPDVTPSTPDQARPGASPARVVLHRWVQETAKIPAA